MVAANAPQSVIYVAQPIGFQPEIEELRRRFLQPQERIMALFLEAEPMQAIRDGFIRGVDERTGFEQFFDAEGR